ncbi:MAG: retropepsin-like domain-containing protein [Deltaproteobacteria bacterium]|nr:retropepsin-like domain-containing protein [Deltaproteobacteria bacterium]
MAGNTTGLVPFEIISSLPFISAVEVAVNNRSITLNRVLVDTGSGGTIFSADLLLDIGVKPAIGDDLVTITGVGGTEYAFSRAVDTIKVGHLSVSKFRIQVGALDYAFDFGFELEGILGMNFLLATKAKLDCKNLTLG